MSGRIHLFTLSGQLPMMQLSITGFAGGVTGFDVYGLSKENQRD
jgi:hypothetical protein